MRRSIQILVGSLAALCCGLVVGLPGCTGSGDVGVGAGGITGGSSGSNGSGGSNGGTGGNGSNGGSGTNGTTRHTTSTSFGNTGTNGSSSSGASTSTPPPCVNLQCQVQGCPNGGHTTISGMIEDPAGQNPLYNVVAYVPNSAVGLLPSGATCGTCNSLFSGDPMADGLSDATGLFHIMDAPVGANIPVIVQVGKWRTHTVVPMVNACTDNQIPGGSINFPSQMDPNDGIMNIPDIAVSTGGADSLECLMIRMGISSSEYVPGNSTNGKIHIFNGGNPSGNGAGGFPETNTMSGAPNSYQSLWDSAADLSPYDIVMLSCEGDETYSANPQNMETYLNTMGGRVFASHFHYAWFAGPLEGNQSYTAPSDWGSNLATWSLNNHTPPNSVNGDVVTTLWNGQPFPKGEALATWLGSTGALGTNGASPSQLYIAQPRENADVTSSDMYSQPWITDSSGGALPTLYFSFNTPVGSTTLGEGSSCNGRAVYSGLHVGGASTDSVNCNSDFGQTICSDGTNASVAVAPPPAGCAPGSLSAQEKALEFMIFDLSSCVVADTSNPYDAGSGPILR